MESKPVVPTMNGHGSDIASTLWWGVPVGFIESRSLLQHEEIPLWNRYSHAGDTLIGQAVSMLGDPLQLIVIFGHGSAWAWDIKFLAAKFLFCVGFGLLILGLLKNHGLSLIYSTLAAYCGAYFYINNHPSFFVLTYAPWILLSARALLDVRSEEYLRWGLAWLLANFACFNAGDVELAVILIAGLNLAAFACALAGNGHAVSPARVLGRMVLGTFLFLGLTAPMWISFLVSLKGSLTAHMEVKVVQLLPTALPGAFDDLFYLLLRANEFWPAMAPGTSLLILTGCSFSVLMWRQLKKDPFFWVNMGAILLWGGCVFGWVPSFLIAAIPLLNRVGHVGADFSYLLVIHLTIQSAYGFNCLVNVESLRQVAGKVIGVGGILAGMIFLYASGYEHQPIPWLYFLGTATGAIGAPLLFLFLKGRRRQTHILGWVAIVILGFIPNFRFGLYDRGNDTFLIVPGPRETLNAPSKAIDKIKKDKSGPFRVVGLQWGLMGDYSAVYELEDIRSCAPLSNGELMNLIWSFPGVECNEHWSWMFEVMDPVQAQPLLNLLNVKYLLAPRVTKFEGQLDFRIIDQSDFCVVENLQVWPRAFFSNRVIPVDSNEEFIRQLLEKGKQPFITVTTEAIEKYPGIRPLKAVVGALVIPATNYRLLPDSTAFDIHASAAGIVCLTEGQAKDFTARVNNEPRAVLTVNRAFKGIYIDHPGDYHVEFIYRPHFWRLACTLFWAAVGGVIILSCAGFIHATVQSKNRVNT